MDWLMQWIPILVLTVFVVALISKYDSDKVRALQEKNERYRERIAEQQEEIRFLNNRLFDARYKWSGPGDTELKRAHKPEPHFVEKAISPSLGKPKHQNRTKQ